MLDLQLDGFDYADLYDPGRLGELSERFYEAVERSDADLAARYRAYRDGAELGPVDESNLLVELSAELSRFVVALFGIEADAEEARAGITELGPIWAFKKTFLGKTVKRVKDAELDGFDADAFDAAAAALVDRGRSGGAADDEAAFAAVVLSMIDSLDGDSGIVHDLRPVVDGLWQGPDAANAWLAELLRDIARWCKVRAADPAASDVTSGWVSFKTAERVDFDALVPVERPNPDLPELACGPEHTQRRRDGFELTDRRYDRKQVLGEVDYCILCHDRDRDSCTKGVRDKSDAIARNPLGIKLAGCPLGYFSPVFYRRCFMEDDERKLRFSRVRNGYVP